MAPQNEGFSRVKEEMRIRKKQKELNQKQSQNILKANQLASHEVKRIRKKLTLDQRQRLNLPEGIMLKII